MPINSSLYCISQEQFNIILDDDITTTCAILLDNPPSVLTKFDAEIQDKVLALLPDHAENVTLEDKKRILVAYRAEKAFRMAAIANDQEDMRRGLATQWLHDSAKMMTAAQKMAYFVAVTQYAVSNDAYKYD